MLLPTILAYYGDGWAAPTLSGNWQQDVGAFGCPRDLPERAEKGSNEDLTKRLGRGFAERYRRTMRDLAKGDGR